MTLEEQISQIHGDINYKNILNPNYDILEKGWTKWKIGDKISWCYKNEKEFYIEQEEAENNEDFDLWMKFGNGPYTGILFTLPGKRFRIHETAVICVDKYPIEKDNPVCDWVSFNRFLEQKDLYKVYKL